jgi:hypothetical protein
VRLALELARFREDTDSVLELYVRAYASLPNRAHRYIVDFDENLGRHVLVDATNGKVVAGFRVEGDSVRTEWLISLQELEEIYREGLRLMGEAGLV